MEDKERYEKWELVKESFDVCQLLEVLIFKYGREILKNSLDDYAANEDDYNPDEIYETIQYELEQAKKYDDFLLNYEAYEIEKDEADPLHWRHRKKIQDKLGESFRNLE